MYYIYIIKSEITGRYYVGQCLDVNERLRRHNAKEVKSTKHAIPWRIIHTEQFLTRSEAVKREMEIKKYKGGIKFKRLLGLWND